MNETFDTDKIETLQRNAVNTFFISDALILVQEVATLRSICVGKDEFEEVVPGKSFILQRTSPNKKGWPNSIPPVTFLFKLQSH